MKKTVVVLFSLMLLFLQAKGNHPSYLSQLALKYHSNKGPDAHNYTQIYEHYFKSLQHKAINFLEIQGESEGFASRQLWDAYFTNRAATLHFIDLSKNFIMHAKNLSSRCYLHEINQFKQEEIIALANKVNAFDVVIDAGFHVVDRQIENFSILFPRLRAGGIYIIEDLFSSYLAEYNGYKTGGAGTPENPSTPNHSTVRFLQSMIDKINKGAAQSQYAQIKQWPRVIRNSLDYYEKEIESIHFYNNLCIIIKRGIDEAKKTTYKPIPLQFSISESKMVKEIPFKDRDFAFIVPGDIKTYIYTKEDDYYKDYQRSLYAVTQAKTGWDCLRHYEILANGCIPYFIDLEQCHPNTMKFLPKELILEAMNLPGVSYLKIDHALFDRTKYDKLLKKIFEHTRTHLTSKAMAEYLLKSVNYSGNGSILYLTCDHFGIEYMRDFTLIGLKEALQGRVIDYPRVPHIYKDYVRCRPLYGNGFSYTNIVDDYAVNRDNIEERIKNKEFDLIIYSISHITLPLYDLVCQYYAPEEIIFICGGEGPMAKNPGQPHHCGSIGLFPNFFLREWSYDVTY